MPYPANLKYTKEHEWVEIDGDRATVGITSFAQQQLGDIVYVELPEVGAALKQGQSFGTVESVKAVSELYAPMSGTVAEINTFLKNKPESINADPYHAWIIKLTLTQPSEADALLDASPYADLVK